MKFREITRLPRRMAWAFVMEGVETTHMIRVFARHGSRKLRLTPAHRQPTPEELHRATEQMKDLPRFLPFFVVVVAPVPGVVEGYALVAVTLEKWLGDRIKLLPSQFRELLADTPEKPASTPAPAEGAKEQQESTPDRQ